MKLQVLRSTASCCLLWSAFPVLRGLLESVRELQHAEVVPVTSDDLQPDRQSLGREAGGHRDRRMARRGDPVAALHPVDVVVELHARDFPWIRLVDREWRHLVYRAEEEVVTLEEGAHAVEHLRAQFIPARDSLAGELEPGL